MGRVTLVEGFFRGSATVTVGEGVRDSNGWAVGGHIIVIIIIGIIVVVVVGVVVVVLRRVVGR